MKVNNYSHQFLEESPGSVSILGSCCIVAAIISTIASRMNLAVGFSMAAALLFKGSAYLYHQKVEKLTQICHEKGIKDLVTLKLDEFNLRKLRELNNYLDGS
jgi:hypothetical protein